MNSWRTVISNVIRKTALWHNSVHIFERRFQKVNCVARNSCFYSRYSSVRFLVPILPRIQAKESVPCVRVTWVIPLSSDCLNCITRRRGLSCRIYQYLTHIWKTWISPNEGYTFFYQVKRRKCSTGLKIFPRNHRHLVFTFHVSHCHFNPKDCNHLLSKLTACPIRTEKNFIRK